MDSEGNPLLTLPRPIVDALFESAGREAGEAKARILRLRAKLEGLKGLFEFEGLGDGRRGLVVVADGSMSMVPSDRIGSSFAIYTAGYMAFEGDRMIDEEYSAGSLSWADGGRRAFGTLLRLLMANAEREAALEADRRHGPDLILIDGPFFYFRGHCRYIRGIELGVEGLESGSDLVEAVRDKTLRLMEGGRALAAIRRSALRAIDGWLIYNRGEGARLGTSDKHILTMVMPPGALWSYRQALGGDPLLFASFYRFYRRRRGEGRSAEELEGIKGDILAQCARDWENKFERDLGMGRPPGLERFYVRYGPGSPPFEVEAPRGLRVRECAEYFIDFHNPATGLPWPMDLIDDAVGLPRGSTTAFAEEVEARLVGDEEIGDKSAISDYFAPLNPQKREFA